MTRQRWRDRGTRCARPAWSSSSRVVPIDTRVPSALARPHDCPEEPPRRWRDSQCDPTHGTPPETIGTMFSARFESECTRQLDELLASHGFAYAGYCSRGLGGFCEWRRRSLFRRSIYVRIWEEMDGKYTFVAILGQHRPARSVYVGLFLKHKLGLNSPVRIEVVGFKQESFAAGVEQIAEQLRAALPQLAQMVRCLRSGDPDVSMR